MKSFADLSEQEIIALAISLEEEDERIYADFSQGLRMPYLLPRFAVATSIAVAVVLGELSIITWVRHRYMETPALSAAVQVALGGAIVFWTGVLIGSW
jgi:hypothetical protein